MLIHPVHRPRCAAAATARGFTLLEALVALVVLSIGLLGIAGVQATSAQYRVGTWARTNTTDLFADIADRIRANVVALPGGPSLGVATNPYRVSDTWAAQQGSAQATSGTDCASTACTPADRAAYDLRIWRARARELLPQGAVLVDGNAVQGMAVTLMWFDKDFALGGALQSSSTCTDGSTGLAAQTCCPTAAAAPAGVRCFNFLSIP